MATALCRGEGGLIGLPSDDKQQLTDDERLLVVASVNKYRSNVSPPAANMLAVVSEHTAMALWR